MYLLLLFFIPAVILGYYLYVVKKILSMKSSENKDSSTKFTIKGKEYNNAEEYFGKFKKRTSESLKKVFGGVPTNSDEIKSKKDSNLIRIILFVLVIVIVVGMIYYYSV